MTSHTARLARQAKQGLLDDMPNKVVVTLVIILLMIKEAGHVMGLRLVSRCKDFGRLLRKAR
jgi:predicted type IV restriction endonuclease